MPEVNQPLHALLVEDSENDAELLLAELRRIGYAISYERVDTELGMRRALEKEHWDIVFCDYSMPSFDAPSALAVLRSAGVELPTIIISGTIGEDVAVETLKLGADDYLLKQNLARLRPAIERALEDAANRRQRKAAEAILRRDSQIFAQLSEAVICTDLREKITSWNAGAERLHGWSAEEMLGHSLGEILAPEQASLIEGKIYNSLQTGKYSDEVEALTKTGERLWMELHVCPMNDGLRSIGFIGVGRDITERRQAEENLRAALDRLALAAQAARAGIWELNLQTNESTWDDQMFSLYGNDPASAPDGVERWFRQMHPDDVVSCTKLLEESVHAGRNAFDIEFRISRADDGSERFIRSMGIIKRNDQNEARWMVGINQDVTENRWREQELSQALAQEKELTRKARAGERAKGEFLAMMSHEIRTPMNGILGFAELLNQAGSLSPLCQDYARTIRTSGEALLRILDDILDFSRLEEGVLPIEKQAFSPQELVNDIRSLLAPSAKEKDLHFETALSPDIPARLYGDAGRLRQVLLNLAGNAIKFTCEGRVEIGMKKSSETADIPRFEFIVRDTGPGIAPDKFESIFHPFVQEDASISRRYGGTGLGLTISKRLVELLSGTLAVESAPGKGSAFSVTLPLQMPPESAEIPSPAPPVALDKEFASRHPLRLLLVEDDRVNLKLICTLTRRLGYEPLTAENGKEAVAISRREHPDCILMDLQMPEMDGIEATLEIRHGERTTGYQAPIFIAALTANIFPADRQRCMEAGMNGYLNKPLKLTGLAEMLMRAHGENQSASSASL